MLPLLAAVPAVMMGAVGLVGGAAALAGGAMSLAGGVMAAGSTMAGIAADAAGGVIGAASRLTGGGKSAPEPQAEARAPADQSTSDEQGVKALPPGVKLNKNGVMIQDSGGPGGGRILPGQFDEEGQLKSMDERLGSVTADRSGASPVNQILDYVKVIAANTARTAMGIGALMQQSAASTAQDNIEGAKNQPPEAKQGMVSKVFGGLRDRMRKINDSLGGVAKFMLKGLGLAGLIYLFKTNEESITKVVAGIFKFFHNLYKSFEESDDPMGDLMKFLKEKLKDYGNTLVEMFKGFYKETIEPMLTNMMLYINDFIQGALFGHGDSKVNQAAKKIESAEQDFLQIEKDLEKGGHDTYIGAIGQTATGEIETMDPRGLLQGNIPFTDKVPADIRLRITHAAKEMYQGMWEASRGSGWSVQWQGMPKMSAGLTMFNWMEKLTQGGLPYLGGVEISKMRKSKPIVNGKILNREAVLSGDYSRAELGGYDKTTMSPETVAAIQEINVDMTNLRHQTESGTGTLFDKDTLLGTYDMVFDNEDDMIKNLQKLKRSLGGKLLSDNENFRSTPVFQRAVESKQLQRNLELYLKHLEQMTESGQTKTVLIDSSSNDNRMTKQGDTINMGLDAHHSDSTARAFHQWYHA